MAAVPAPIYWGQKSSRSNKRFGNSYLEYNRLGFSIQLGTIRFLGVFLANLAAISEGVTCSGAIRS